MKTFMTSFVAAATLSGMAIAQEAVPLTYELFELTWTAIEYEGRSDTAAEPTMIRFSEEMVGGTLACGGEWNAPAKLSTLPNYRIEAPWVAPQRPTCAETAEEEVFLRAIGQTVRIDTTPDGLGFFAEDGRMVVLAVAGG